jgi:UDP-N-acetylglucosamine 4-epimerase
MLTFGPCWLRQETLSAFIYAAKSFTHIQRSSKAEDIGKPLPETKYVNELYATIFSSTYGIKTIGLGVISTFLTQDP